MAEEQDIEHGVLMESMVKIVTAQLGNSQLPLEEVTLLIGTVHDALSKLAGTAEPDAPTPAVPINRSVTRDYIICLEDGRQLKTLKRHLSSAFNMTPEEYRTRWGLTPDYPMVAPNYARKRSALAKEIGLGRRG
jgi:predicted transcriptional regulator